MAGLSVRSRRTDLAHAATSELDVLVVGMGATGAGVALDAASRGLSVVVLDQGDLASGTSSKSSKLVHGGLRYLENYEFGLVREGVVERQLLMRLAPHLVLPMDFLYPVWPDTAKRRLLGLGLSTYDVFALAQGSAVRRHERLSAQEAIALAPALADSGLAYSYLYGDCGTDDARLVLAVVQAAHRFGALVATYTQVRSLLTDQSGRVVGVVATDQLDGSVRELRARHVVNATGVWVDRLQREEQPDRPAVVQPSKGVHLVVPEPLLPLGETSVLLPSKQGDGRSMFAIPWGRQTILGTTDTPYDGDLADLSLTGADLDYVLAAGNAVFRRGMTPDDVLGAWAGVRPLIGSGEPGDSGSMSDISRRHTLVEGVGGMLTITGGKLTTYRRMAKDVVDRIVERDGRRARCRTEDIPLTGLRDPAVVLAETSLAAEGLGLSDEVVASLVRQTGEHAVEVLSLVSADPSLGAALTPHAPHIAAEVVHAARSEGAMTLADVYARRMRISLREKDAGVPGALAAARLLAAELGRDEAWAAAQVGDYAEGVRQERGVLGLR